MSIKGIGPVSAAVLLSVIGDIRDFSDPGKLAAYWPGAKSAELQRKRTLRPITKQGNKLARTALVQCALIAKRYSSFLQQFYQRSSAAAWRQGQHRPGAQVPGVTSHPQEQLGAKTPQLVLLLKQPKTNNE